MWRTCLLASVLLLGGCVPYQSVSGKVYPPTREGAKAALVESGSIDLHCAPSEIRKRHVLAGHPRPGRLGSSIIIAEGCGQRATYVEDCSHDPDDVETRSRPCPNSAVGTPTYDCHPDPVCELILVSKVPLD